MIIIKKFVITCRYCGALSKIELISLGKSLTFRCVGCGSEEKIVLDVKKVPANEKEFNEELKKALPLRPLIKQKIIN